MLYSVGQQWVLFCSLHCKTLEIIYTFTCFPEVLHEMVKHDHMQVAREGEEVKHRALHVHSYQCPPDCLSLSESHIRHKGHLRTNENVMRRGRV